MPPFSCTTALLKALIGAVQKFFPDRPREKITSEDRVSPQKLTAQEKYIYKTKKNQGLHGLRIFQNVGKLTLGMFAFEMLLEGFRIRHLTLKISLNVSMNIFKANSGSVGRRLI